MRRLLIRPGGIGDLIVSLPALESLRAGYTEVWVAGQNQPLIRFADRVDSIVRAGLDGLGVPEREPPPPLIERLRRFDSIGSWYGANRLEFHETVEALGLSFQFFPVLTDGAGAMHAVDYYLAQARSIGGSDVPAFPRIDCPRRAARYAVIHPFSSSPKKNWPLALYREVAAKLGARMPVHWCAGPEEALEGAVRWDNLYELAGWLAGARLYVGNDSGISHLAAAVGTPVVALFGPTDPARWGPRGRNVKIVAAPSMDEVRLSEVLEAVSETLRQQE